MDSNDSSDTEEIVSVYLHLWWTTDTIMNLLCSQKKRDRPRLDRTTIKGEKLTCVSRTTQVSWWETIVTLIAKLVLVVYDNCYLPIRQTNNCLLGVSLVLISNSNIMWYKSFSLLQKRNKHGFVSFWKMWGHYHSLGKSVLQKLDTYSVLVDNVTLTLVVQQLHVLCQPLLISFQIKKDFIKVFYGPVLLTINKKI